MKVISRHCIFIPIALSFHTGNAQSSIQLPQNILQYYQLINKAEMSIVNGKTNDALKFYIEAFTYFLNGFSFDYRNVVISFKPAFRYFIIHYI
ncbi:MAG TPA: hypothetical protein VK590_15410 [Saprospiraceae bacterium]|nr:hypothetical protein [Saprospiraceae bacterium]